MVGQTRLQIMLQIVAQHVHVPTCGHAHASPAPPPGVGFIHSFIYSHSVGVGIKFLTVSGRVTVPDRTIDIMTLRD
jgi:hypothetical protein